MITLAYFEFVFNFVFYMLWVEIKWNEMKIEKVNNLGNQIYIII